MKETYYLLIHPPLGRWQAIQNLFIALGRADLADEPETSGYRRLDFGSREEVQHCLATVEKHGFGSLNLSIYTERHYTLEELRAASFLTLRLNRAGRGDGGPTYGTEYDLSTGCSRCGAGAVQTSPLVLRRSDVPAKQGMFYTGNDEYLVSDLVGAALEQAEVTGLELRPAVSTSGSKLPWLQLVAPYRMPPMAPSTRGLVRDLVCLQCTRSNHYGTPYEPLDGHYTDVDPEGLPDVVHTWECYGVSVLREPFKDSRIANPLLLIRPRVYDVLREYKVKQLVCHPIVLE
jgi:hypothetical protein